MHITRNGPRHLGLLSLLSLVACNDAQLKTLGEIETGDGGGSAGATSPTQASGAASGGSATESTAGAQGGAEPSSAAGSGGSLSNGAGGSLPNAGGGVGGTAANAGAAGASKIDDGIDACSNKTWTATATVACMPLGPDGDCGGGLAGKSPADGIDGDPTTRYTTGYKHRFDGTEEFSVAFPSSVTISGIVVDRGHPGDYPIAYALEFSTDGVTFLPFSPPVTGPGSPGPSGPNCGLGECTTTMPFPATAMKAIKIKQIGVLQDAGPDTYGDWWSIAELTVIACKEN